MTVMASARVGAHIVRRQLHLERLKRQFELLDLPLDLLGTPPELLAIELRDPHLQGVDQRLVGLHRGFQPHRRLALSEDDRLQRGGVIERVSGASSMFRNMPRHLLSRYPDPAV